MPHAARLLLGEHERLLVLAPWTRVAAPLDEVERALDGAPVVLLPRLIEEIPDDDRTPTFEDARELGTFDTGFLALRRGDEAGSLLDRWPERLVAPLAGARLEKPPSPLQTWFDALPATTDGLTLLRDAGYGWAWWNAGVRPIAGANGTLTAGGSRSRLAAFPGFDPTRPARAERAPGPRARIGVAGARGADARARRGSARLGDGRRRARRRTPSATCLTARGSTPGCARSSARAWPTGELSASPFTNAGMAAFYDWLAQPATRGASSGLNRYHERIWLERLDLRTAYPNLDGPDGDGFAGWVHVHAGNEHPMPAALLPPKPEPLALAERERADPLWGVNVAGFFRSELGLGEAARLLITGLDAAHVPALPCRAS